MSPAPASEDGAEEGAEEGSEAPASPHLPAGRAARPLEDARFGRLPRPVGPSPWAGLQTRRDWQRVLWRVAPCMAVCALFGAVGGGPRNLLGGAVLAGWAFFPAAVVQVARREREGYWATVLPILLAGLAGGAVGLLNFEYLKGVDMSGLAGGPQGAQRALARGGLFVFENVFQALAFAGALGVAAGLRARAAGVARVLGSLGLAALGSVPFVVVASGLGMAKAPLSLLLGAPLALLVVGGVLAGVHALVDSIVDGLPAEGAG
ncbi:MAG: hypothetical protein AB7N76_22190 [Planctomycetota bacterium]